MHETSKTRRHLTDAERAVLRGRILDIGAGPDPVTPDAIAFDLGQGDANHITAFPPASFDCVWSSHCLEHMRDVRATLANWWSLVKPGGHLVLIVPDEDLYEQGCCPSRFNDDHKQTFTLAKKRSWSPRSHNLFDLCRHLPGGEIVTLHLNDIGYDRRVAGHGPTSQSRLLSRLRRRYRRRLERGARRWPWLERWLARTVGWDQTQFDAIAQLEAIVHKVPAGLTAGAATAPA
jgi:SAM-dependent methyltransferase